MKNKIQRIFDVIDSQKKYIAKESIPFDKEKLDKSISNFYSPGPSFQYTFDFSTKTFDFVSDNARAILGVEEGDFTPKAYYSRIHPHDLEYVRKCEEIVWFFLYQVIDKSEIPFYKVTYQIRIKDKQGNYKLSLHQAMAMTTDEDGHLSSVFCNDSDISHITTTNNYRLSFIDVRGEKSYYNIGSKEDLLKPEISLETITSREIEILKYVSEGVGSKEIAERLHISYDTVRTHRNNILKKTKFNTLTQVVCYYIKEGLIWCN